MRATEVILYMQVDLVKRHCFPVYWNAENRRVMRGHWFARKGGLDWLPLREDVAEQLEIAYRSRVGCLFSYFYTISHFLFESFACKASPSFHDEENGFV